jgi:UDP-N-acetylmuramoyl-L-alanyl-D-glutamate--2,6-diaminopimelate ligase
VFRVDPGRAPLADLIQHLYGAPSTRLTLLGVTGTNGKATVTFLVAQMLGKLGVPCGILGGLGHHLPDRTLPAERTTPEAPDIAEFLSLCLVERVLHVAMEVSSIGISEERTRGLRFGSAAYTNLTQDHLDYHGTMEAYQLEKERLFLEYDIGGAVLNGDDAAAAVLIPKIHARSRDLPVVVFSLKGQGDLTASDLRLSAAGTMGMLHHKQHNAPFALPLPGRFNVANWLTAVGLLLNQGYSLPDLADASSACTGAPGRLESVRVDRGPTVLVDYAHTPDALETVLRTVRPLTQGRVIVVFGCGGDRDRDKRPKMGAIAENLSDVVVLTTDNPRSEQPEAILAEIRRGMRGTTPIQVLADRTEAIHAALGLAHREDLVLLAGKGAETYQEVQGKKFPFDDREVVRNWAHLQK